MRLLIFLILSCIFAGPFLSFAQPANGLVAHYYFNKGNTENDCGAPAKGVGVSFTEDRFGNENSACFLYGSFESYLNLGSDSILKPKEGSVSLWIKMAAYSAVGRGLMINPVLLTKNQTGDDFYEAYSMSCEFYTHRLSVNTTEPPENQAVIFSKKTLEPEEWHHLVITFSKQLFCLYVDGVLQGSRRKNFYAHYLAGDPVLVGATANEKNKRFFFGTVDDISIYNRPLTQDEVLGLYREANPNRLHNVLRVIFIVLLSLLAIYLIVWLVVRKFRKELKKEKEKNNQQRLMYEMEVKVIKAQMNPHFIFNSMNSIQQFILANDTENAYTYLVRFAQLLRKILESNTDESISMQNEIDILRKYIEIEALRFDDAFTYEINVEEQLNNSVTHIPQMLVQPFVENAIWHGLLPKEGARKLKIAFKQLNKTTLSCTIEDNGVGRRTTEKTNKTRAEKSLGIQFIIQRLELMHKEWKGDFGVKITDLLDEQGNSAGTRVQVIIPIVNE